MEGVGAAVVGGLLLGASIVLFMALNGRVTGLSGIVDQAVTFRAGEWRWRWAYIAGVVAAASIMRALKAPGAVGSLPASGDWPLLVLSGLLVGIGTSLGNGCTSGHGLCGLSRLSRRSAANVAAFFSVSIVTATFSPSMSYATTMGLGTVTLLLGLAVRRHTSKKSAASTAPPTSAPPMSKSGATLDVPLRSDALELVAAFVCAMLFAAGLGVSQVTNANVVLSFLRLDANWSPTVGAVMFSAISVGTLGFRAILQTQTRSQPLCAASYKLPTEHRITTALLVGGVLFGMGWGLVGLCPGTALFNLGQSDPSYMVWFVALVVGIHLHQAVHQGAIASGAVAVGSRTGRHLAKRLRGDSVAQPSWATLTPTASADDLLASSSSLGFLNL